MGIDPMIWGSSAWSLIHSTAFNVKTNEDQRVAKHMYYSFLHILPCSKCRKNYDTHLVSLPIPAEVSDLAKWSYIIHKRISPSDITFQQAKQKWCDKRLDVRDILPFLDSLAATHPSARNIDAIYRDNLYNFIEALRYFLKEIPPISKQKLVSRTLFKQWLKKVKNKNKLNSYDQKSCNSKCNA